MCMNSRSFVINYLTSGVQSLYRPACKCHCTYGGHWRTSRLAMDIHSRRDCYCLVWFHSMDDDACRPRISQILYRRGTGVCWYVYPSRMPSCRGKLINCSRCCPFSIVWRFRQSTAVTADAPLSEPSQRITSQTTDLEKEQEVKIETANAPDNAEHAIAVHIEEEKFEWREVVRGLIDVQVWLTAIAYMGIIVPLYSFSLFLCVYPFRAQCFVEKRRSLTRSSGGG